MIVAVGGGISDTSGLVAIKGEPAGKKRWFRKEAERETSRPFSDQPRGSGLKGDLASSEAVARNQRLTSLTTQVLLTRGLKTI